MAVKKIEMRLNIDGVEFVYSVNPSEEALFAKAEEIVNREIELLRKHRTTQSYSYERILMAVLMKIVLENLRKGDESEEVLQELDIMNNGLSSYLDKN